nr:ABC transporter permease [Candidatus Enterousia merdequi]
MTLGDIFRESWISVSGNKLRSFLTVLGIVIGVMAVVIMVAVGETVQKSITDQFSSLGTNTIVVRAGAARNFGVRSGSRQTLTITDAEQIKTLNDVMYITPAQMGNAQVIYGNKNWATTTLGTYPDYFSIQDIEIEYGTMFDMNAVKNASAFAVIGPDTAFELGLPDNPVGEFIRIGHIPFVIVGVMKARGDSSFGSQDDIVIIPITTLKKRLQGSKFPDAVSMIALKIFPDSTNNVVIEQITSLLRDRHRLKDSDENDFQITDMKQIMETMDTVTGYLKLLLIAIAAVSLLVGSIGIMNMMLTSVAERTREIGVRKAIGARERMIIIQFLSESVMISFIGSMAGLILGIGLSQGIGRLILNYDVPVSIWPVVLSMTVALIVGLASGVVPAIKAAKLNPIDSLRYE